MTAFINVLRIGLLLGLGGLVRADPPFNNPPGVDVWCGKAYRATDSSFDPGGALNPPEPLSPPGQFRLSLKAYAQYSYYLPSEKNATLIVDTSVSAYAGAPYTNKTYDPSTSPNKPIPFTTLKLFVRNDYTNEILLNWVPVPVNVSGTQIEVSLAGVNKTGTSSFTVIGNSPDGIQTYHSSTTILILPDRNNSTGSISRIDRLYGGIYVRSHATSFQWQPIFPYSFYTSWDWIRSTFELPGGPSTGVPNLSTFRELGYNIIHPVPPGGSDPFDIVAFEKFLTLCDSLKLYVMYDMRHTYRNLSSMSTQLSRLQNHSSLLLYYTADEPDGWTDPLNATSIAYQHIQSIDPYHPVSLVLNCQNFYFGEYTAGADIILEDTYPVIESSSFSPVYNTVCNSTYGDCGCDNCHVNDPAYPAHVQNVFLDISQRVDSLYTYQTWLQSPFRKPIWGVPQGFYDEGSFWSRWPTAKEEAVMALLRIVHGVKGVVAWLYPTSPEVQTVTSQIAKVITRRDVTSLLLGQPLQRLRILAADDIYPLLDAAAWVAKTDMLVIIVHQGTGAQGGKTAYVELPKEVEEIEVLYGYDGWKRSAKPNLLVTQGLEGLDVSILKAKIGKRE